MPPYSNTNSNSNIQNNTSTIPQKEITMNTNYFGTDGVIITENKPLTPKKFNFSIKIMVSIFIFLVIVSVSYAYFNNIGFFSKPPYSQGDLFSGLFNKMPNIDSASYSVSMDVYTMNREDNSIPFEIVNDEKIESKIRYERDLKRSEDIRGILSVLNYYKYSSLNYPTNLSDIKKIDEYRDVLEKISLKDPLSDKDYKYSTVNNGKDFSLEVTFEDKNSIKQILNSNNILDENKKIKNNENTLFFNKNTQNYIYLSSKPPMTLLEYFEYVSKNIPPELKINASINGASNFGNENKTLDWKFNVIGQGDLGDLTYKLNIDLNRKDGDYFAKINNFPQVFFFSQIPKGQWIKLNSDSEEGESYFKLVDSFEEKISDSQKQYLIFMSNFFKIADEEKIYGFREKIKTENIDGKNLYKYNLKINKDSIIPFYKRISEEIYKDEYSDLGELRETIDNLDLIEYFESNDFDFVFDYFDKNLNTILWVNSEGYPVVFEITLKIVPSDSVEHLKDKQIMYNLKLKLEDINQPINVETPTDFKNMNEVMTNLFSF